MRRGWSLCSLVGVACAASACVGDVGVKRYNTDPALTFTEPNNGDIFAADTPITLAANVSDGEQPSDELDYVWTLSPSGEIDASGQIVTDRTVTLILQDGLEAGTWEIHLQVFDNAGAVAEDSVQIATIAYIAPTVTFLTPAADQRVASQGAVPVSVQIADPDQGDLTALSLSWGGAAAGLPGLPTAPDADGRVEVLLDAPAEGAQTLTLTATDSTGRQGSSSVAFTVVNGDADGDGYLSVEFEGDDCDDADSTVHPGALENCDGDDDDCDGEIDEDPPAWYGDGDGDGYGTASDTLATCEPPAGYVAADGDCDDADPAIYPSAPEYCDGIDNDCDGRADESPTGAPDWYADADSDGHGDPNAPLASCDQPAGHAAAGDDCDDGDATIYPGAPEVCDGADQDCDGQIDDNPTDPSAWYRDLDSDGYGDPGASTSGCAAPAGYAASNTDCDDANAAIYPGAQEVCNGFDDNCDGSVDGVDSVDVQFWYADADSDGYGDGGSGIVACDAPVGYVSDATDCDDGAANTHPSAQEVCDSVDNDCDGLVDDNAIDAERWYVDADGDSAGDGGALSDCAQPAGYAATDDDCDDGDAAIHPGADEYCDGVDNDCDGTIDEDDALDAADWYADIDGDSYGDPAAARHTCAQPGGTVANALDCDDGDAQILPGGDEQCNGYDDDCDALVDDADPSLNLTTATPWYADSDSDGYGDPSSLQQRCVAPAGYLGDNTDCDDLLASVNPSEAEVCGDGLDNDCSGVATECDWGGTIGLVYRDVQIIGDLAADRIGNLAEIGGDADADGNADLWIVAQAVDTGGSNAGALYLFGDPANGRHDASDGAITLLGAAAEGLASALAVGGDLNGDGVDDLILGNTSSALATLSNGAAHVLYGPLTSGSVSAASSLILTGASYNVLGACVAYGDLNGDGSPDLIAGGASLSNRQGVIYSLDSPTSTGTVAATAADLTLTGAGNTRFGATCASADLNADDFDDLIVGAPTTSSSAGAVWLFEGPISGTRTYTQADGWLNGPASSQAGIRLDLPGDIDSDGRADLLVNGSGYNGGRGAIWLVHGSTTHQGTLATLAAFTLSPSTALAWGAMASGSFDLDGTPDLVVGVSGDDTAATNAGATYLYADIGAWSGSVSNADATAIFPGEYASDLAGTSVSAGDVDGDGQDDLLITAPDEDSGGTSSGSAYLLRGPDI